MFPVQEKIKEQEEPFFVDYVITAKGWRASGGIKCRHPEDKQFWRMLQIVVMDIIKGHEGSMLNECYKDGFARYVRPVKKDDFTLRWVELDHSASNQPITNKK